MFFSLIDSVSSFKAKVFTTYNYVFVRPKSSTQRWPKISCFRLFPFGLLAALLIAKEFLFGYYYPRIAVKFVALRSCQGMYTGVPDPGDIGLRSTPSFS